MTGPSIVGTATVNGSHLVPMGGALHRHATILGGITPTSNASAGLTQSGNIGGLGGYFNGPQMFWSTGVGSWVEWDLGMLETTRPFDILFAAFTSSAGGIVRGSINGTNWANAAIDSYNATTGTGFTVLTTWTPPANVGKNLQTLRLECTGKHASSSGYTINMVCITIARSAGATTIVL